MIIQDVDDLGNLYSLQSSLKCWDEIKMCYILGYILIPIPVCLWDDQQADREC